ncbi:MAG: tRNA epoxyqueuosine(34) reductase QueG [Zetaproteobacteria bacterium CG_4_9_14_3_um_filter_49_83]|nr:MAG: tRNA epoxyqueuosine(34) reductase QueG [Zetaproteobacteria bacterium CG1_02_49_23]PIQ30348.1 MAG: tRNA epoxyqueuosine(34) reductase QueG [Zetaproteobacteria bacterium CG17_big_fil_post_rev_8_21_14_2_50_50_13]PIV31397.1 MAG: tRNA epoxyqueuosine(34) reductase QueG [Zetaproteobacteria bacterium CG02_land_8_20_14_3_00_50_9]PIY56601.1 MAG: tRNA epoxyqueuosine(34) reductase QueG [Zetaproteobacteria bacterium CG_4_10_14_0_8_um_filter_49_80]PJA33811.1 MAG: tRNA epoxyqueuosine(34) reductase QueG
MKQAVRTLASQYGFDLCHVTRAQVNAPHPEAYQAWLAAGMHGEMAYMAEAERVARRQQPQSMLPGVRSVIAVAMRYTPPAYSLPEAEAAATSGVISTYAHGDDYHDVMKKRLKALARDLDELLGVHQQRVYVDTAPVLEHALAASAGLGWQGKHSLTINREFGSWLLLGELFTTADIEPDTPASNHCGSCSACIDVCPTAAIVAPYVVDARRCISYLSIEYRGYIPHALRPLFGNRIYGCDDCQMVCPWNRHASVCEIDFLRPRGENILPELASLLHLDDQSFRIRFARSPIKRTGRDALLRNVCVAMGNSADRQWVPMLHSRLQDESPLVRAFAFWAIEQLAGDDPLVRARLMDTMAFEHDQSAYKDMFETMEQNIE